MVGAGWRLSYLGARAPGQDIVDPTLFGIIATRELCCRQVGGTSPGIITRHGPYFHERWLLWCLRRKLHRRGPLAEKDPRRTAAAVSPGPVKTDNNFVKTVQPLNFRGAFLPRQDGVRRVSLPEPSQQLRQRAHCDTPCVALHALPAESGAANAPTRVSPSTPDGTSLEQGWN